MTDGPEMTSSLPLQSPSFERSLPELKTLEIYIKTNNNITVHTLLSSHK